MDYTNKTIMVTLKDGKQIKGLCTFCGINTYLHGKFQVTVDRIPIWDINPSQIKLIK